GEGHRADLKLRVTVGERDAGDAPGAAGVDGNVGAFGVGCSQAHRVGAFGQGVAFVVAPVPRKVDRARRYVAQLDASHRLAAPVDHHRGDARRRLRKLTVDSSGG